MGKAQFIFLVILPILVLEKAWFVQINFHVIYYDVRGLFFIQDSTSPLER
jgi:hypothetical protein